MNSTSSENHRLLIVDPDVAFGSVLKRVLAKSYVIWHVAKIEDAIAHMRSNEVDVVLSNWDWPSRQDHSDCHRLLEEAQELEAPPSVIVFSWDMQRKTAMEAFQLGAFDFFLQPLDIQALKFALDRAYRRTVLARDLDAARQLIPVNHFEGLIGNSKRMCRVYEMIKKVAGVNTTVLVAGESGTGKELIARAVHRLSPRRGMPFVAFSACALPETLIEDELFGHEKGAFTSASQGRRGRFEEAQGGTIFLDEIGDLAPPLQAKLLRVLQERRVERLGSNVPIPVDVRVICATNRNLEAMLQRGTFRQDLYFRISVLNIELPPLRERTDDIPVLAEYFLRAFSKVHRKAITGLSSGYLCALASYGWPGNVRELQNVIERSLVLADGTRLGVDDLPIELRPLGRAAETTHRPFQEAVLSFKRELIRSALRLQNGNRLKAAQELSISRCYLHRLLRQLHVDGEKFNEEVEVEAAEAAVPALKGA